LLQPEPVSDPGSRAAGLLRRATIRQRENTMLRRAILFAIMLAGTAPASAQQAGIWSMGAPLPLARSEVQAATVGGKIYVAGGGWTEAKAGKQVEHYTDGFMTEYDPQTNQWRERARSPEGRTHEGLAVLDGK